MVQFFSSQPVETPASQIAGSLGVGLGKSFQQSQLADLLFGQQGNQFRDLPIEAQLQYFKTMQPKSPLGGISGQSVPEEVSSAISNVISQNEQANSDELALKMDEAGIPRAYSNPYIENRRRQQEQGEKTKESRFSSEREYQSKRALPFMKKLDEMGDSIAEKDQALNLMKDAISEGNLGFFSQDNLANMLGKYGEGLRTAKGAQLITAQKEFLLGNISRAGARPNMYIEQQISKMLPQIGRSEEANESVVRTFEASQNIEKEKRRLGYELANQQEEEFGFVKGNIAQQTEEALKPYAKFIQDKLSYQLKNIQEKEMGDQNLYKNIDKPVRKGTPLTLKSVQVLIDKYGSKEKAFKKAKSLGYWVPTIEEYRKFIE